MDDEIRARNATRYLRAADRLNRERAQMDNAYIYHRGKVVGFMPCDKALGYLAALYPPNSGGRPDALRRDVYANINNEQAGEEVLRRVYFIPCPCHSTISINDLRSYEYEQRV